MIKFSMSLQDLLLFNKHYIKKHGTFIQKYLQWLVLLLFIIVLAFQVYRTAGSVFSYLLISCFVVIMILLQGRINKYFSAKAMKAYANKNPAIIGERIYEYDEQELRVKVGGIISNYPYGSMQWIEEGKSAYYVYISEVNAIIIPKRLLSNTEAQKLVDKIKSKLA